MDPIETFKAEWPVIQQAPLTFVVVALVLVGITWAAAVWFFRERMAFKDEQISGLKDRLDVAEGSPRSSPLWFSVVSLPGASPRKPNL